MKAENDRLRQEIERQAQEIEGLKRTLEERFGKKSANKQPEIKPSRGRGKMFGPWPLRKQRSAEQNHGRARMEPTETKQHQLEQCPTCGGELVGGNIAGRREVIDLPEVLPYRVTEHQLIRRKCVACDTWHTPQLDLSQEVSGQRRFGHNLVSWVCYMRVQMRMPFRQIKRMLAEQFKLKISEGELAGMAQLAAQQGDAAGEALKQAIRSQPVVHADETSWREDGQNGWVWLIRGANGLSWFEFSLSRATSEIQRLLGLYAGTLVADFYAVYNFIGANRQRCWAHLMRDIRELELLHAAKHPEIKPWLAALEQLYRDANIFIEANPDAPRHQRQNMAHSLAQATHTLSERWLNSRDHPARAMCKRLRRHEDELFHFVRQTGVPATNNAAERAIRPLVIGRKISGGTRSPAGTKARLLLHSLATSWEARGLSVLDSLRAMLRGTAPVLQV